MIFKNYYDYCQKTKRLPLLSYIYYRGYKHNMIINSLKINYRKLKCYLTNQEYKPYPKPQLR